ncbi:plasmid recombination protein [Lentibacter sp. XHP0401]|uniref:plasmid recombination protein n=1 Tax=Lentibacter sp. XHP0401 TaxID=2984334 RepID=UPI0021E83334|nr:plasmid recombination protein [Lentibacter sp. XHP0401]MCV2892101.1 plasmid recombination protein [Lentibacter sp. XHP0401]
MAYQFVHIQTYSPKLTKVAGTKDQFNNTVQVFGEAARDPEYSTHVPDPQKPEPIMEFGAIKVPDLRKFHDERRAGIKETVTLSSGRTYTRALKSDFPTLYTEIHSHPMRSEDYLKATPEEKQKVKDWMKTALKDFTERMPKGVKFSAVMHLDETHLHIHILAVNAEDPKLSASKLHVGKIAAEARRSENGPSETLNSLPRPKLVARPRKPKKPKPSKNRTTQKKRDATHAAAVAVWEDDCARIDDENAATLAHWEKENGAHLHTRRKKRKKKTADVAAYQAAMTQFQDHYYEAVGKRCGFLRNGPRAERLSTKTYAARKDHAKKIAEADARLQRQESELIAEELRLEEKEKEHRRELEELAAREARVQEKENKMVLADQAQTEREAKVNAREEAVQGKEHEQAERARALDTEADAQKRTEVRLETDRSEFEREQGEFDQTVIAKGQELTRRERQVERTERETGEALSALSDLVGQFEQGDVTVENERLKLRTLPEFIQRMKITDQEKRTPAQKLVSRFIDILKRTVSAIGGGPEIETDEPDDRPGM